MHSNALLQCAAMCTMHNTAGYPVPNFDQEIIDIIIEKDETAILFND